MVDTSKGFLMLELVNGLLHEYDDGKQLTSIFGFVQDSQVELPSGYTHFGMVVEGEIKLINNERERTLYKGDFFSVIGQATIKSNGRGMVSSAGNYKGFNMFGGPIEKEGRLRYIEAVPTLC